MEQIDFNKEGKKAFTHLIGEVKGGKATSVSNLSLMLQHGMNGTSSSGEIKLNCTASVKEEKANLMIVMNHHEHQLMNSVSLESGDAVYVGSFQSPTDKGLTEYVFIKATF